MVNATIDRDLYDDSIKYVKQSFERAEKVELHSDKAIIYFPNEDVYLDWYWDYFYKSNDIGFNNDGDTLPPIYVMEAVMDQITQQLD